MKIHPVFNPYVKELITIHNKSFSDGIDFSFPKDRAFFKHDPNNFKRLAIVIKAIFAFDLPVNPELLISIDCKKGTINLSGGVLDIEKHSMKINNLVESLLLYKLSHIRYFEPPMKPDQDPDPEGFGFLNLVEI